MPTQATWIAPDSSEWPLTSPDLGWFTLNDVKGVDAATPISFVTDAAPGGGSVVRHIHSQSRLITWALHVFGEDQAEFLSRWRGLALAFTRTRTEGPGTLVISREDGSEREISAYYQDGFTAEADRALLDSDVVLTLFCEDGYWRDRNPTTVRREYSFYGDFLNPFPTFTSSQTLGATEIENLGNVEAYPSWVITGPASSITATNETTGESWTLDPNAVGIAHGNLIIGETVIVTTNPPAVRGPLGEIWTGTLNWPTAVLWALKRGINEVTFGVSGAGAGTSIEMSFEARWETA